MPVGGCVVVWQVHHVGAVIGVIVAETEAAAQEAARKVRHTSQNAIYMFILTHPKGDRRRIESPD